MTSAGVFSASVSATQNAVVGSMANKCAVLVSKAEDDIFNFKNVSALVKFNLAVEGVKSLTLMGNNDEPIAGKFTCEWNDGDPQITAVTAPQVAVTLRKSDGSSLELGDYYFTIIPTNFEDGFSVVLGMNDDEGTQKIVTRSAALDLKKNQIFRTQNVPESAYKAYSSNYLRYNDGFAFTFNNVTINKTIAGDATYVYKDGTVIKNDGVYFVSPDAKDIELKKLGTKKFFVMGDDSSVRSSVNQTSGIQPQEESDGYIVLANLNMVPSVPLSQFILQQTEAKGGFANFGSIVVSNCKVNAVTSHFIACNNRVMTLGKLVVEDSDFLLNITTTGTAVGAYIFNTGGLASTINNVIFDNNVFHNIATNSTLNRFRMVNSENDSAGATLKEVTVTNNTLVGMLLNQHGYVRANTFDGYIKMQDNFFVNSHPAGTNIQLLYANTLTDNMSCEVKNNFYYTKDMTKGLLCNNIAAKEGVTRTTINPVPFTTYPLSPDWDPAKGVFGYISGLKYGSLGTAGAITEKGTVAAYRGAQR